MVQLTDANGLSPTGKETGVSMQCRETSSYCRDEGEQGNGAPISSEDEEGERREGTHGSDGAKEDCVSGSGTHVVVRF